MQKDRSAQRIGLFSAQKEQKRQNQHPFLVLQTLQVFPVCLKKHRKLSE